MNGQLVTALAAAAILDAERICGLHAGMVRDYCRGQVEAARRASTAANLDDYMAIQHGLIEMQLESLLSFVSKWNDLATEGSGLIEALSDAQADSSWSVGPGNRYSGMSLWQVLSRPYAEHLVAAFHDREPGRW